MSEFDKIKARLAATTKEPFYKRVAIMGGGPTRYMLQPYLLEEDIAFILGSRGDMARLVAVVEAVLEDTLPANEAMVARKSAEMAAERAPRSARCLTEKAEAWEGIA